MSIASIMFMMTLSVLAFVVLSAQVEVKEYNGPWRTSLDGASSCWTQTTTECNRAMVIVHGGDWSIADAVPYDSSGAFLRGWENGADMVKGDFRVNKENIGMIMHSSPIEYYESVECAGGKVEDMTTAQCEACPMVATGYNFTSSPEMLTWANEKINFMFCMKEPTDIPRAIESMLEYSSHHRAILEIKIGDLLDMYAQKPAGWDSVYYIAEINGHNDAANLLAQPHELLDRAFLVEFDNWDESWSSTDLQTDLAAFKSLGCRTMAATVDNSAQATKANHRQIYDAGFDVVYTYNLANAVVVRQEVNTARGISPP